MTVVNDTADTEPTGPTPAPALGEWGRATTALGLDDEALPTRLMVLGLTHRDGTVHGPELYRVAAECGIGVETVRSCMRRLTSEGLYERSGEGRDAVYRATAAGRSALDVTEQRHLLAYAQDAAGRLVSFAIPESNRTARDSFRDHLLALGGASIQPGLYVSPHRWTDDISAEAERLGITEYVSSFSTDDLVIAGESDPRRLAARLWPLEDVAARYEEFISVYSSVPDALAGMRNRGERISEHEFLPGVLHIAIRFNGCFEHDPLLPPELLPRPWPGRAARDLLARCRRHGMLAREEKTGPALFRVFDEAIAHLP